MVGPARQWHREPAAALSSTTTTEEGVEGHAGTCIAHTGAQGGAWAEERTKRSLDTAAYSPERSTTAAHDNGMDQSEAERKEGPGRRAS